MIYPGSHAPTGRIGHRRHGRKVVDRGRSTGPAVRAAAPDHHRQGGHRAPGPGIRHPVGDPRRRGADGAEGDGAGGDWDDGRRTTDDGRPDGHPPAHVNRQRLPSGSHAIGATHGSRAWRRSGRGHGHGSDGRITKEDIEAYLAARSEPVSGLRSPSSALGFISPVVSRLVAELGVDLTQVIGTGADGRITKKDVLAYVAAPTPREPLPVTESLVPSHLAAQESQSDGQPDNLALSDAARHRPPHDPQRADCAAGDHGHGGRHDARCGRARAAARRVRARRGSR